MTDIIPSLLDNDLYKFTQQFAVLELFPSTTVTYRFYNRGNHYFNQTFLDSIKNILWNVFPKIHLSLDEKAWLKNNCPYLKPSYLEYLYNYRYNPENIKIELENSGNINLNIKGLWHETILWEVPLMALISETYFNTVDTNWKKDFSLKDYRNNLIWKNTKLENEGCLFAEFGTRRRRSFEIQDLVVKELSDLYHTNKPVNSGFVGTSNVHLAMKYNVRPIGTLAHEWVMGNSVLEGLRNANYYAMQNWVKVFNANLGTMLTDTYGTDAFFANFNLRLSKLWDGLRHDSGDPLIFAQKAINHYKSHRIDPMTKTIIFSDNLNVDKAANIRKFCEGKIKCSFGIGTNLTNDIPNSKAMNMVIKLDTVNEIPVIKLSDDNGKVTGNKDAVRVAKWTFFNKPLDEI